MKKIGLGILVVAIALTLSGFVSAAKLIPLPDKAKEVTKADNSPVINKVEIEGEEHLALTTPGLEKIVFIHYKKGFAKPPWAGGGKDKPKESKCYEFLGRGVKWQDLPVNYVIDPDNPDGLTEEFITSAIVAGVEEWDANTSTELFGSYAIDYNASWDNDAPDGRNELVFGDYPEEGVIGVAVIWGYFSGPPHSRRIVEFDVLFDIDFAWGDGTLNPAVMDLQNIATHEIGHGVGLGDVYETACSEVTMYGYSTEGETKKRTLEQADVNGIQELYGF